MSKIIVRNLSPEEAKRYFYACVITFPNGKSTKLVEWEFKAAKQSGRIFIFVMLLYYVHQHHQMSELSDYQRIVKNIDRL